jgi:phosphatidylglycerophosphate synthase
MRFYRYLYYKFFRFWQKSKRDGDMAEIRAASTMSLTFTMLVGGIMLLQVILFKEHFDFGVIINDKTKIMGVVITVFFGIFNWFFLAREKPHNAIVAEFENETEEQRKRGTLVAIVFLTVSLASPIVILVLFVMSAP